MLKQGVESHRLSVFSDQVGENFVFEIAGRYFGQSLDAADESLFSTQMKGFSFSRQEDEKSDHERKGGKWKTYLIIFLVVILFQILRRFVF